MESIRRTCLGRRPLGFWAVLLAVHLLRAIWLPVHLAGDNHAGHGEHHRGELHDLAAAYGATDSGDPESPGHEPHPSSDHTLELLPDKRPTDFEPLFALAALQRIRLVAPGSSGFTLRRPDTARFISPREAPRKRGPPSA